MEKQKTVLVTGGTGFVGSHLIEELKKQKSYAVHATSFSEVPSEMESWLPAENFHRLDLTDSEATFELLEQIQPDQIYHLAAFASAGDSFEKANSVLQNNITLQINMLNALKEKAPHARLLSIGSADGYGVNLSEQDSPTTEDHPFRPVNPYAVSKVTQELLAAAFQRSHKLDIVFARPFNHIGERQTTQFAIPAFASQIVKIERGQQSKVLVGNLSAIRDVTDVKDIVRGYITLMENGKTGESYNLGSGRGVTMQSLLDQLIELSTAEVEVEHDPAKDRPLDIPVVVANVEKIKQLGWQAQIPITETLERVLNYWRNK